MGLLGWLAIATAIMAAFAIGMEIGWWQGEAWGRKMARVEHLNSLHK